MVSLRERKPRPSYSDIPAGLSDLSGSEDSESRRPSCNGFDSGLTTKTKVQADERHSPFSGDSSEFEPDKETEV